RAAVSAELGTVPVLIVLTEALPSSLPLVQESNVYSWYLAMSLIVKALLVLVTLAVSCAWLPRAALLLPLSIVLPPWSLTIVLVLVAAALTVNGSQLPVEVA